MNEELQPEQIAAVCHEANRAYCALLGDFSQPSWEEAPQWQIESAIAGVEFHAANPQAGAAGSHHSWMEQKIEDGWVYGDAKDPDAKTHPCMVPFADLPEDQQMKDVLFVSIVRALTMGAAALERPAPKNVKVEPKEIERGKSI